ncbi:MAG: SDR family oxidoreductase [Candidatus Rokubacteria bacterium]|nr:SDR family oxidoreductase [Candidatus Rokubacteria bacterium]
MKPQQARGVKKLAAGGAPSGAVAKLAGRVALVTGGAVRLGRVIALALAREGCDVAINYHRSGAAARATVRELRALGVEARALRADVSVAAEARRLVGQTLGHFGRLDLLVNNAAIFFPTPFGRTTPAQWDRLLAVNLRGPFLVSQAAARVMQRAGTGRIVNIADVGGVRPWPSYIPYCVSKAGLLMLTRGLAVALAPRVQVNCVAPGAVLLPEGAPAALRRRLRREVPMGREGDPADVAAAVVFFATCPAYITGQVLFVDGGVTAQ